MTHGTRLWESGKFGIRNCRSFGIAIDKRAKSRTKDDGDVVVGSRSFGQDGSCLGQVFVERTHDCSLPDAVPRLPIPTRCWSPEGSLEPLVISPIAIDIGCDDGIERNDTVDVGVLLPEVVEVFVDKRFAQEIRIDTQLDQIGASGEVSRYDIIDLARS